MRNRLREWMVKTRDIAILEETEMLGRLEEGESPWDLAQSLDNYERILRTANLQVRGEAAIPELLTRTKNPDSAIRFWAVLGLVATRSDDSEVIAGLQSVLADESVSVRLTAAEGLFNRGLYEKALPRCHKGIEPSHCFRPDPGCRNSRYSTHRKPSINSGPQLSH